MASYYVAFTSAVLAQTKAGFEKKEYLAPRSEDQIYDDVAPDDNSLKVSLQPLPSMRIHLGYFAGKSYDVTVAGVGIPDYVMKRMPRKELTALADLVQRGIVEVKLDGAGSVITAAAIMDLSTIKTS